MWELVFVSSPLEVPKEWTLLHSLTQSVFMAFWHAQQCENPSRVKRLAVSL
ncbi:MAG: hypothetical protein QXW44_06895 [Pyrobaculum sp.]